MAGELTRVYDLLRVVFRGRDQLAGRELQQRATDLPLSARLRRLVQALPPEQRYDQAQAGAAMARIQQEEGIWRDETELPLAELDRALATSASDGQSDDRTGHEAGPAEKFGDEEPWPAGAGDEPDPDTAEGRRLRPSPEGGSGPH